MTTTETQAKTSLYVRCAVAADRGAWSVERDIKWAEIDRERAFARPDLLASLRDAALIESYHPVNLSRLLRATLDDIDAGVAFSLELYEGFKHFHSIRRYLEAIGYEPPITDEDLVAIRSAQLEIDVLPGELIPRLVEFMLSEHLAHYFFRRLGEQAEDNVLADLLSRIAADEVRRLADLWRRAGLRPLARDADRRGVVQVAAGDCGHALRQRRREQHRLAAFGRLTDSQILIWKSEPRMKRLRPYRRTMRTQ